MSTRRNIDDRKRDVDSFLKNSPAGIALYSKKAVNGSVPLSVAEVNQLWQNYLVAYRLLVDMAGAFNALSVELNEARAETTIARKITRKVEEGVAAVRDARSAASLLACIRR